ncbi:MAG: IS200/IS605 family transposase [Erysipelotrichaceae bacterium]
MKETNSLAHTTLNSKNHIVFTPKYGRKVFYDEKRLEISAILWELCRWKGITLLEAKVCSDHIHLLLELSSKYSASSTMNF